MKRRDPLTLAYLVAATGALSVAPTTLAQSCGDPGSGSCCVANATAFCDDAACCTLICSQDPFCCDVQWDGICASAANAQCVACGAQECQVDCAKATSEETELCGEDLNGGCNAGPSGFADFIDVGDIICGTYWADGNVRDTDWYEFTIESNQILSFVVQGDIPSVVFLVTASCPASIIASSATPSGACEASIVAQCVPAGTYRVVVAPNAFNGFPCDIEARYQLSVIDTGEICVPLAGDTCDTALEIEEGTIPFDTVGAFTEGAALPGQCASFGSVTMFNDIWFAFTASETSPYLVSTCNDATFDTRLAVYSGSCDDLVLLGCNDDGTGCAGFTSRLQVPLTEGERYYVRLGGFSAAAAGTGNLTITPVEGLPNDECSGAVTISDGLTNFTTIDATTSQPPLPSSCEEGFGLAFVNDIWFAYTATCTDDVTFSTCGTASFDTRLALYSGTCEGLSLVACNDDGPGCPGFTSQMVATLIEGETYFLRIGGFLGSGSGIISIECGASKGVPNDECDGALPLTIGANAFSTIGASGATDLGAACISFGSSTIFNDVWFTWTATGNGDVEISTCNSASFDTRIGVFTDCSLSQVVACNDDTAGCGLTSRVNFTAQCGVTYRVSIGAFGTAGFGAGTVSVTQSGNCPQPCPADLDGNGVINAADLTILLGAWGTSGSADISGNGSVGAEDLALLLGAWGNCS